MQLNDIIANMRNYADRLENSGGLPSPTDLRTFAGGIEHAIEELKHIPGNNAAAALNKAGNICLYVKENCGDEQTARYMSEAIAAINEAVAAWNRRAGEETK